MVSRQEGTFFTRKRDITIYGEEFHDSFKKSKHEEQSQNILQNGRSSLENMRSITFDFDLHLHTPLTSDCEKSTKAKHGYSRTSEDKESVIFGRPKMSLDLELNLSPSYSPSKTTTKIDESSNHDGTVSSKSKNVSQPSKKNINRSPSWLAFEVDNDDDDHHKEQEMVTTVCMKCHMLVMLCKSTPVCPNCKFMHPHDHSSTKQF